MNNSNRDLHGRTKAFALRIIRLYASLPKSTVAQVIGKQFLRSVTSIGAHYAEASRSRSDAEFVSKLQIGLQEIEETRYWIELLTEAEIVTKTSVESLLAEINELTAIMVTIVKKIKGRQKAKR